MRPNDILEFFYTLVDDEPDESSAMILMDAAYTKRNDMRMWTFLIALDSSISHLSSDTWQTEKTLPTDFEIPEKLYVGASDNEYEAVPFENVLAWLGAANRFTIDYGSNKLRFLGGGSGQTAYLWYKKAPTSLIGLTDDQKESTTTILWPKRFCPILAFDMAAIQMGGIDADDIARQQVPYQSAAHRELFNAMIAWDTKRRMKMFGSSSTPQRGYGRTTPADVADIPGYD